MKNFINKNIKTILCVFVGLAFGCTTFYAGYKVGQTQPITFNKNHLGVQK